MTRSSEVSRVEPTSAMVTRSRAREGRGISVIPQAEFEPETEFQPEPEIQVSMSTTCEIGFGAARPFTTDTASQYIIADKPEVTATFTTSQEIYSKFSTESQTPPPHNIATSRCYPESGLRSGLFPRSFVNNDPLSSAQRV